MAGDIVKQLRDTRYPGQIEMRLAAAEEIEQLREALVLAEDILSRAPFSTEIWPNGMHPQKGIGIIRAALSFPSGNRKSET